MIICSYNSKGGVGKSTSIAQTAKLCYDREIPAIIIDGDMQRNTSTFLSGSTNTSYTKGQTFIAGSIKVGDDTKLIEDDSKLILIDCPPDISFILSLSKRPDIIIVPIDSVWAGDGSVQVIKATKEKFPDTRLILWCNLMHDTTIQRQLRKQIAEEFGNRVELCKYVIADEKYYKDGIAQNKAVWDVQYSKTSDSVKRFKKFCEFIINECPRTETYFESDDRSEFYTAPLRGRRFFDVEKRT